MDKQFLKDAGIYILTAVVSVILIAYIVYSAVGGFSDTVETLTAVVAEDRDTVSFDAYVMRSEKIIYSSTGGGISYLVDDEDKVAASAALANIYADGGGQSDRNQIISLDREISVLENSNIAENILVSDTAAIDSQINELYGTLIYHIATGDIDYALRKKDSLLTLLNKRKIIVREVSSYDDRITLLEDEKAALSSSDETIAETITAPAPGYFYSEIDGYEDVFSSARVDTISLSDFDTMTDSPPRDYTYIENYGYSIGKLMTGYVWYVACETTSDMLRYFRDGNDYTVIFPYSNDVEISMEMYRIITDTDSDRVILIFRSGNLPENFNFLRRQTIEVVRTSYTGYRVPISAVRIIDGVQGVYTLDGNIVEFKEIVAIAESGGYFIIEEQDIAGDEEYYKKLGLYDQIIIKGKDLYEGKIIS